MNNGATGGTGLGGLLRSFRGINRAQPTSVRDMGVAN